MTTISNLPSDLAEEILSRIPLKSLREVRFTCKKWNSLTQTQSFTKLHIGKAATTTREGESQMMVMMMDYNLYLMSVVNGSDVDDPYIEHKGMLTLTYLNDSDYFIISEIFHCEGLLLFVLRYDLRLVVWNPYWGQPRWIQPRYSYKTRYQSYPTLDGRDMYAFGYVNKKNKSCHSHKILKFRDDFGGGKKKISCEIYDFDSNLWRILNVTPHWRIYNESGISLKGNTYWCAKERKAYGLGVQTDYIICFDFTRERFGPLLPTPFSAGEAELLNLSCVREEKLVALFQRYEPYKTEIWITTKIEAEKMSWSTFLTVDTAPVIEDHPIWYRHLGSFFIDEEMKVVTFFHRGKRNTIYIIGEAGYFREVYLGEAKYKRYLASACSYVPSLVQISRRQKEKTKRFI